MTSVAQQLRDEIEALREQLNRTTILVGTLYKTVKGLEKQLDRAEKKN